MKILIINCPNHWVAQTWEIFISFEIFCSLKLVLFVSQQEGRTYSEAVFNETINIVEVDEGLDGETFFLYLFLAAGVVLLLVLGQQALASMGKRRGGGSRYGKMWFCLFILRH